MANSGAASPLPRIASDAGIDHEYIADVLKQHRERNAVIVVRYKQQLLGSPPTIADHWGVKVGSALYHVSSSSDGRLRFGVDAFDNVEVRDATFWGMTKYDATQLNDIGREIGRFYETKNYSFLMNNCQNFAVAFADFICSKRYENANLVAASETAGRLLTLLLIGALATVAIVVKQRT